MEFNAKSLAGTVVTVAIICVLVATVLLPITSEAQKISGPSVELENAHHPHYYKVWEGEDVTFSFSGSGPSSFAINGETYVRGDASQYVLIASDFFSARNAGTSSNITISSQTLSDVAPWSATFTFEVVGGNYTLTTNSGTTTGELKWMVYVTSEETNLSQVTTPNTFQTSDKEDIIVLGNIYTTGQNKTYYAYFDGELTVNPIYQDDAAISIEQTKKEGYTNIYDTSVLVTVGEETFTPLFILAPVSISGNEAGGATYSLVGIIPILVLAGVVIGVIGMFVSRRD